MSGYDICRQMRRIASLHNKPILMLTANDTEEQELMGLQAGADDYLTKPIQGTRLLGRLNTALRRNIRELDANPLTHLPGNTSIVQEIDHRLTSGAPFAVIYGDLNHFKSYNDRYGFLRGDQVLKLAAQCLVWSAEATEGPEPAFVGHLGGDDYVAVVPSAQAEPLCQKWMTQFDKLVPALYDSADRKVGHVVVKNRQGQVVDVPIVSIAMVIIKNTDQDFRHPGEISELASELKTLAKSYGKSTFVVNRRKKSGTNEDKNPGC
jgi:diguanylate cyclase (GGDEF)-like protein